MKIPSGGGTTLKHVHYWVVEFHPITAAIRALDSVALYFEVFYTKLSLPDVFYTRCLSWWITLTLHSILLHLNRSLPKIPLLHPSPRSLPRPTPLLIPVPTPIMFLSPPPVSLLPPSLCRHVPTTAKTFSLPAAGCPSHRGPELVTLQYIARLCSVSL